MEIDNREIYENALRLLGQSGNGIDCEDLEQRAPYLLASFCCLAQDIDRSVRKAQGLVSQPKFSPVYLSLDKPFPLSQALTSAAAFYLAAMLLVDENPERSDSLYDKYCDSISSLQANSVCFAECESISEKYFFD